MVLEDWYRLRKRHFNESGGGGLFRNRYSSSILQAMQDFRPNYGWKPWLFGGAPNGFWKSRKNRSEYMRWLGDQLGFQCSEDWYQVTTADFFKHHGGGLLNNHFGTSVQAVLADYIRDFDWKPWLFSSVPQNYWRSAIHRRHYLSWLGDQLGFSNPGDWCRLTREDFCTHGGSGLLSGYYRGSTTKARQEYFRTTTPPAVLDQRLEG